MDLQSEIINFAILGLSLLIPAVVVFIALVVIRIRRSKFHRQRITHKHKGHRHPSGHKSGPGGDKKEKQA
jgi:hypothetical protein